MSKSPGFLRSLLVAPKPEEFFFLTFAITYLCNSKCTMCNIWQKYRKDPHQNKEELSAKEIRNAISTSQLLRKTGILLIGGGEPFLKNDFTDIVLAFNEVNPSVQIIIASNGQTPDLIESKLKDIRHGFNRQGNNDSTIYVGISLDGMEETHERMRGIKGAFRNALRTADIIRNIKGFPTGFIFTFTPENYKEFLPVLNLSKEMNIPLTFQFGQTSSHYYDNRDMEFRWTREQIEEVRDLLKETRYYDVIRTGFFDYGSSRALKDRLLSYNRFFLDYVLEYQLDPARHFNCFSGTHSGFLDPYGNVFPCISLGKSVGNIREQNFDMLWKSSQASEIRKGIAGRQCHCSSFCDIPNSLPRNWRVLTSNLKKIIMPG
jgi:MoaA/NifB/PqqE/SkfB family radical SAM enzyme